MNITTRPTASELEQFAEEANQAWEAFCERVSEACKEALLLGQALNRIRPHIRHGQWMDWIATHCPKIVYTYAAKSMALANLPTLEHLNEAGLLAEYHRIFGHTRQIAAHPDSQEAPAAMVLTVKGFAQRVEWIARRVEGEAMAMIHRLPPEEKKRMGEEVARAEHALGVVKAALGAQEVEV